MVRRFLSFIFISLFFTFHGTALGADNKAPITVKAEVDNAFVTIGDPVLCTVTMKYADHVQILTDIQPPASDILKVKKTKEISRKEDGMKVAGKIFTLTSFKLGEFVIDPITIQYRENGGEVKTIATNSLYITVKSVAEGEEKTDIRGIKSVANLILSLWPWFTALGIALIVLTAFFVIRATRKVASLVEQTQKLSPEDETLIQLSQLYDSDLLRRGKIKEYHLKLSEILRGYLENRFDILAVESTTYEIWKALKLKEMDPSLREKINEVLEAADLAKFAKWDPGAIKIKQMYEQSRQIIEMARPKENSGAI